MSIVGDAIRGGLAGAAATFAMDQFTSVMLASQAKEVTRQEEAARPNGKGSVANLVDRLEVETGYAVPKDQRPMVEQLLHYALGIIPGAIYGVLRRWVPLARLGSGVAFGLLLFAANDEYMNTKLGLSGPMDAYPPETHLRGLAGHAVLGVATETGIQLLGG
jgi:hypothetical protein